MIFFTKRKQKKIELVARPDGHGVGLAGLRPPPPSVAVVLLVQSPGGHVWGHPGLWVQAQRATPTFTI